MRRAALLVLVLLLALGASAEDPSMSCDPKDCEGCVQCTAIFIGDAWPHWTASVKEEGVWRETWDDDGLSLSVPVDTRWTLVTMTAVVGGAKRICRHLFRRPEPTGGVEHRPFHPSEVRP